MKRGGVQTCLFRLVRNPPQRYNGDMKTRGQILFINPWIYDFAAYNLWIEPLGLLTVVASFLECDYGVTVLDCLAPFPGSPTPRMDGSGRFLKTIVGNPAPLDSIPRRFGRYGWPVERFDRALDTIPTPDVVMVASGMTYWYPGVAEAIRRTKARFGAVPVAVGGIYATLCPDHARQHIGANRVFEGPGVVDALGFAGEVTGHNSEPERFAHPLSWPAPAHELVKRSYAGINTSWGCPFRCSYCASHRIQPAFVQRRPSTVVAEIVNCARRGIRDMAFYDDALLVDSKDHLEPILTEVLERGADVRFHTPNGLRASKISARLAKLMREAGFATIRLSLETVDTRRQRVTGGKVTTAAFEEAVAHLKSVGYGSRELGAYILAGLPNQPLSEVEETVRFVHGLGVQAKLALFSPIPGTEEGDLALPPGADPLLHNNTAHPYSLGEDYVRALQQVKLLAKEGNEFLRRDS
jgi:pyruvate-formate lyase-activating enzyme